VVVNILTYCPSQSEFYGNSLIFKTLRVGFPNAKIFVYDNASPIELSIKIKKLAWENDCYFTRFEKEIPHYHYFEHFIVNNNTNEPIIFLDPDICFWESCENWKFNSLLAGRLIPEFCDDWTGCITHARIHTSFLWIPNTSKLVEEINSVDKFKHQTSGLYFSEFMYFIRDKWFRFDTMAMTYSLFKKQIDCFDGEKLNSYDHLFFGTHLNRVKNKLPQLIRPHEQVKINYKSIKGIWRKQEEYFNDRKIINE
jgi:hypothetical protein